LKWNEIQDKRKIYRTLIGNGTSKRRGIKSKVKLVTRNRRGLGIDGKIRDGCRTEAERNQNPVIWILASS